MDDIGGLPAPDAIRERRMSERLRELLREAVERFRGVDPETGEADYWNRGGLAGLLGMPAWHEQPPTEIAMGFAGSVTPAVKALASSFPEVMPRMAAALGGGHGRNPGKLVNEYVKAGMISEDMRDVAKSAAQEIKDIKRQRSDRYLSGTPDLLARAEKMGLPSAERYARELREMRAMKIVDNSPMAQSWAADRARRVRSLATFDDAAAAAEARLATVEAIVREARKMGMTVRHTSKGGDGRVTSRYIKAPDGSEWRISDHHLPYRDDKPDRGWGNEIVADDWRTRSLADYMDQILRRGPYADVD